MDDRSSDRLDRDHNASKGIFAGLLPPAERLSAFQADHAHISFVVVMGPVD
jgi:hypothetical protein